MSTNHIVAIAALFFPVLAQASTMVPTGYVYVSGPNGGAAYRDDTYDGTTMTGELTDGISATVAWPSTDGFGAPGPNVGWLNRNPIITFTFDQAYDFGSMVMNAQDSRDGAGVGLPLNVIVTGSAPSNTITSPNFVSPNTPNPDGLAINRPPVNLGIDLTGLAPTDTLTVQVQRDYSWTFLSEFTFSSAALTPVPVPAGLPLALGALGVLGWVGRRKAG